MLDPVVLDFAFGLAAVTVGIDNLLLTREESAAWEAAQAACQAGAEGVARPLIVRSGPRAQAAVAMLIETGASARQGL